MRHLSIAVLTSLSLIVGVACDDEEEDSSEGTGGVFSGVGGEANAGEAGAPVAPSTGGSKGSDVEFIDLPGKIRFINLVSDGTAGVNLDLYWGTSIARSEKAGTIDYGDITEFMVPRRLNETVLDPDEARFFIVPEGDVTGTASSFLVQDDQAFAEETVLTIALAAAETSISDALVVGERVIHEHELSAPPDGMAHVYGYSSAFDQIEDGDFVLIGTEELCDPDRGDSGGANLGTPYVIPAGETTLAFYDANTDPPCDTGTPPITETLEEGHSYVLLGEAETYELDARTTVWLEVGTEN